MENTQEEQKWALGTLAIFVILLIVSGISDFVEVGIGVCTFLFSWLVVSYSIRNFGKGGISKEELQKEIQVFSIILISDDSYSSVLNPIVSTSVIIKRLNEFTKLLLK